MLPYSPLTICTESNLENVCPRRKFAINYCYLPVLSTQKDATSLLCDLYALYDTLEVLDPLSFFLNNLPGKICSVV